MRIKKEKNIIKISTSTSTRFVKIINEETFHLYFNLNSYSLFEIYENEKETSIKIFEDGFIVSPYTFKFTPSLSVKVYIKDKLIYEEKEEQFIPNKEDIKSSINIQLKNNSFVYGLGDKAKFLSHKGYEYISYNLDTPLAHNEHFPSLYKSINYLLINNDLSYFGIFYPCTYKTYFNILKDDPSLLYIASKGEHDYFLFLGRTPSEITKAYSTLIGKPIMPSLKMLGYNQSRWSYENELEVKELAQKFKENELPLDYIHLDIDYMDHFKDFTYNKDTFPSLKELSLSLEKDGISLVTILDAGIKKEEGYEVYDYLIKNENALKYKGEVYVNEVWPGESIFPNFLDENVKTYFKNKTKEWILTNNIDGIWCDMNEPASFKGELPPLVEANVNGKTIYHEEFHNVYGEHMVKAVHNAFIELNKRPYVITRAAFATTSKYTTCWNGDNQSLWHHLHSSLPQIISMGLSGFPLDGVDIGGFINDTTEELLSRWIEANIFSPLLRNHSSKGTRHQEPWSFSNNCLKIYKKMLTLRYEFTPYLYDLAKKASETGEPIIRPIFYNYPFDEHTFELNDEIMIGENLILAPILEQGKKSRIVYFPEGNWVDYFKGTIYEGGKEYIILLDIDEVGLFVKEGSIIPKYKNLLNLNKEKIDTLYFEAFGSNGFYINYEDDGTSLNYLKKEFNLYAITLTDDEPHFTLLENGYISPYKKIIVSTKKGVKEFINPAYNKR